MSEAVPRFTPAVSAPAISVVVPAYQRPDALRRCVAALQRQSLGADRYEVLVVDDGSTPPLRLDAAPNLRLLRQDNAGPAAARNRGAAQARGRFVAFTDDDCAPASTWLAALLAALAEAPDALVGGRTVNAVRRNAFSQASQDVVSFLQASGEAAGSPFFAGNNVALSRRAFEAMGGFDTAYRGAGGEDRALCLAWHRAGRPFVEAPGAVVWHHHALSARGFWKQHAAYGRGAFRFRREGAADAPDWPTRLRFYAELLRFPFRDASSRARAQRSGLLGAAQVATAWGYLQERLEPGGAGQVTAGQATAGQATAA